jgi:hypothetical protein
MRKSSWAELSLMSEGPLRQDIIRDRFAKPRPVKLEGDIWIKYASLSPRPIPHEDFAIRYPDVPFELAHQFVILHELGHAVTGWSEATADEFAFRHMKLRQDPKAKRARMEKYAQMKHPGDVFKR